MSVRQFDSPLRFMVQSEYDDEVEYLVDLGEGNGGVCACWRSWNFRERCKHILLVRDQFCNEMIDRVKKSDLNIPVMDVRAREINIMEVKEDKGGKEESVRETIGTNRNHKKQISVDWDSLVLPLILNTPAFRQALHHFTDHRKNLKRPLTQHAMELIVKQCEKWGEFTAIISLENAMTRGWAGIFKPKSEDLKNGQVISTEDKKILSMDPLTMDEETRHQWIALDHAQRHGK